MRADASAVLQELNNMKKILLVGTGGTIACVREERIHLDRPFKILTYMHFDETEFVCVSPFTILSENMDFSYWQKLTDYMNSIDFDEYDGVILLHGSDTLRFTGALVGNAFPNRPIVLVASDKPLEDESANGFANFQTAVDAIKNGIDRVYISYDGLYSQKPYRQLENPRFRPKNILVISPYVQINYDNYCLDGVDAVLHTMYHSATAPAAVHRFLARCRQKGIPFYFVTENDSADYESAKDFDSILFHSTLENAYAQLCLTETDDFFVDKKQNSCYDN